jgi:hypothetical protein
MDIQYRCSEKNLFHGLKIVFSPTKKTFFATEKNLFRYRKNNFHATKNRFSHGSKGSPGSVARGRRVPGDKGSHRLWQGVAVARGRSGKGSHSLGHRRAARASPRLGPTQSVKIAAGAARKFFLLRFLPQTIFLFFVAK